MIKSTLYDQTILITKNLNGIKTLNHLYYSHSNLFTIIFKF